MIFGQRLGGDTGKARNQNKRLVANTVSVTQGSVTNPLGGPLRLIFDAVKAYGTDTHALLDKGAVPDLMSWNFSKKMTLAPTTTDCQVAVTRIFGKVFDCVEEVPVSCGSLVVLFNFLVVRNAPFDAITESTTLKSLQTNLDYGCQQIALKVRKREFILPLLIEPPVIDGTHNGSKDFTSSDESEDEQFYASSSSGSGDSDGGSYNEHELVLEILSKEPCGLDLRG